MSSSVVNGLLGPPLFYAGLSCPGGCQSRQHLRVARRRTHVRGCAAWHAVSNLIPSVNVLSFLVFFLRCLVSVFVDVCKLTVMCMMVSVGLPVVVVFMLVIDMVVVVQAVGMGMRYIFVGVLVRVLRSHP